MKYLLRLSVDYMMPKDTIITGNNIGLFWDGVTLHDYAVGHKLTKDVHCINYSYMANEEWVLSDYIHMDFKDLLEGDLAPQWVDLSKPIIFLMSICGDNYGDVEHGSLAVVKDFEGLAI